jgi:non-homologous end joining protein Ku
VQVSEEKAESGKVVDLVEALKRSVGNKGRRKTSKSPSTRRKAG